MAITVSVNNPAFPEGTELGVDHLGIVPNGGSLEVSEENESRFVAVKGMTVEDAFKGSGVVKVSGSSSVENAEELIGDRKPPGPDQGVVVSEEEGEASKTERPKAGKEASSSTEDTQVMPPGEGTVS